MQDRAQREDVVGRIDALVRSGLDGNRRLFIAAYGSFLSGLYSPHGDLDLSIEGLVGRECATIIGTGRPLEGIARRLFVAGGYLVCTG